MCFVDLKKTFDRVLRNVVERSMRKKGIPETFVATVKSVQRCKDKSESRDIFF